MPPFLQMKNITKLENVADISTLHVIDIYVDVIDVHSN